MAEIYNSSANDSARVYELKKNNENLKKQVDCVNREKVNLQTEVDELIIANSRLAAQVRIIQSENSCENDVFSILDLLALGYIIKILNRMYHSRKHTKALDFYFFTSL